MADSNQGSGSGQGMGRTPSSTPNPSATAGASQNSTMGSSHSGTTGKDSSHSSSMGKDSSYGSSSSSDRQAPFNEFTKLFSEFRWPGVDMEAFAAHNKENLNALLKMGNAAVSGMTEVSKRQTEIIRQTMEEAMGVVEQNLAALPADQRMAKQTAIAQMAFEKALSNAKELAEIVGRTSRETSDIVNKRITASVEEFRKMVKPS